MVLPGTSQLNPLLRFISSSPMRLPLRRSKRAPTRPFLKVMGFLSASLFSPRAMQLVRASARTIPQMLVFSMCNLQLLIGKNRSARLLRYRNSETVFDQLNAFEDAALITIDVRYGVLRFRIEAFQFEQHRFLLVIQPAESLHDAFTCL